MKSTPRVAIQDTGNGVKPEGKPALKELKFPAKRLFTQEERARRTAYERERRSKKRKGQYSNLTPEQKAKKLAYMKVWHARKKAEAAGAHLPYPFKFCPDCAAQMPTLSHRGKSFLMPCNFCPKCGYEIPIMPKARVGRSKGQ